ncbi:MAG: hypothetical protein NTX38_09410 [Methylobacter sp.]|nr:hypothetical protein [Methylobacter sp.]
MKKGLGLSCCIKDLDFGDKLESNHSMRPVLKVQVVSDRGKGGYKPSGEYWGDERK